MRIGNDVAISIQQPQKILTTQRARCRESRHAILDHDIGTRELCLIEELIIKALVEACAQPNEDNASDQHETHAQERREPERQPPTDWQTTCHGSVVKRYPDPRTVWINSPG